MDKKFDSNSECNTRGHVMDNQGICHRCGHDPASDCSEIRPLEEFEAMLMDTDPDFELSYLGGGYQLEVFRVHPRVNDTVLGYLRCGKSRWHIVRFGLPEDTVSPCPLVVEEDDDGDSWSAPGWNTRQGFVDSLRLYPVDA